MATPPQLELDNQLCFALYDASRAVARAYGPLVADLGLTYPQYLAMLVLWEADGRPVAVGELARRLHLDSGTLTPLLKRLEQAGLVVRRRDPSDERRVLVALTDEGAARRAPAARVPEQALRALGLDADGAVVLRELLRDLVRSIEPERSTA